MALRRHPKAGVGRSGIFAGHRRGEIFDRRRSTRNLFGLEGTSGPRRYSHSAGNLLREFPQGLRKSSRADSFQSMTFTSALPGAMTMALPNPSFAGPGRRAAGASFSAKRATGWRLLVGLTLLSAAGLRATEKSVVIDKGASHIEIAVKATVDSFVGKLADFTPTILTEAETGKVTTAKVTFHFNDVKTGNEKRDREMHVWQQTDKFPEGDFALGAIEAASDGKLTARGALSLHGVTKELAFPVTVIRQGTLITVDGEAVVDTRLYGLPVIRKFALLKVDPLVTVRFHLNGTIATP